PRALGRRSPRRRILGSRRRIASSRLLLNAVMQLNHTIFEAINGVQIQGHVTMTPRYQWDAVPNENGGHTDDELVDRLRVKKRGNDLATAHQPRYPCQAALEDGSRTGRLHRSRTPRLTGRQPAADDGRKRWSDSVSRTSPPFA